MTQPFLKRPHSNRELLDLMTERGLRIPDPSRALLDLETYGYHRLGGYRYPFRVLLPPAEQNPRERRFRTDDYIVGASHTDVMLLYAFDRRLREVVLRGLLELEARLRAAIIEIVSARGAHAHLDVPRGALDQRKVNDAREASAPTLLDKWRTSVEAFTHDARNTDAIAHHLVTYPKTPLPIWLALDIVPFGSLPHFMDLMRDEDRNAVASRFGVRNGNALTRWVRAFVDLRNICAHDVRLFNTNVKRKFEIRPSEVPPGALDHMIGRRTDKIYMHLILLSYVLQSHPAGSDWPLLLRTQIRKFPKGLVDGGGVTLSASVMGFPEDWESLPPWAE